MQYRKKYGVGINDTTGATETGASPAADNGGDMGTEDWVGIGMQVAGALANQKEEERNRATEQTRYQEGLRIAGRNRMDTLQQNAVQNQQTNRSQNQKGLDFMSGLVSENEAAGRKRAPSFRQSMLYGGL